MKKILFSFSLLLFAFSVISFSQQPKTVTDYYLAMPSGFYSTDFRGNKITGKAALAKHRKSLIKIEDVKNGYLKLESAWEGWAEIVLFKRKDGNYLIAQAESGCGPVCTGFIKFFDYQNGKWTDVTDKVFPVLTEAQIKEAFVDKKLDSEENGANIYFVLPREGTTVRMACNECSDTGDPHFTLLEFIWNGEKFAVKILT